MKVLACLFMAWPLIANAQGASATPGPGPAAIRTIPDETFQRWIKEDNKLIDGILASLTRIDALVSDIERAVRKIPDFAAMPGAARPAAPLVIEKEVIREVHGPLGDWQTVLAGAALLALLAFWFGTKQGGVRKTASGHDFDNGDALDSKPSSKDGFALFGKKPAPASAAPIERSSVQAAPYARASLDVSPAPTSRPSARPNYAPVASPVAAAPAVVAIPPEPEDQNHALEVAEIMRSMGFGSNDAQAITDQIRNEPMQALRHWLKLLDVYRKNGQREEFERSAEELLMNYNVRPADWNARQDESQSIEDYPHLLERIVELWGKPDCLVFMQQLLDDNREGARSGFPQAVAEELLLLTSVMSEAFGFLPD
jgi:hypothetical protein